jgi:4-amino-4-deoxy-L-arabinose transferase-like glycosyltransferase
MSIFLKKIFKVVIDLAQKLDKNIFLRNIAIILLLSFYIALSFFKYIDTNKKISGYHAWRSAQTFSVARNFIEEDFNIFQPRYDLRGLSDGRYPGEFPIHGAVSALAFKVFGVKISVARRVSYIFSFLTAVMLFFIIKKITTSSRLALITTFIYETNRLTFRLATAIMPESAAVFFSVAGLCVYLFCKNKFSKYFLSLILICIAAAIKPPAYFVFTFIVVDIFVNSKVNLKSKFFLSSAFTLIPLIITFIWKNYTMQFEHYLYNLSYSLTHHYARTAERFWIELNMLNINAIISKILRKGLHYVGIISIIYILIKNSIKYNFSIKTFLSRFYSNPNQNPLVLFFKEYSYILGCLLWILANITFLLYAGQIQYFQQYYAFPLILPCVILTGLLYRDFPKTILIFICLLPALHNITILKKETYDIEHTFESYNLEKYTNTFSTRDDLFLIYPLHVMDFTIVGMLGRKGLNVQTIKGLKDNIQKGYKYLYINKKDISPEVKSLLAKKHFNNFGEHYFYSL